MLQSGWILYITLSERASHEKTNIIMTPLTWSNSQKHKIEWWLSKAGGRWKRELFNRYKLSDLQDENSVALFPNNVNILYATEPYIQK